MGQTGPIEAETIDVARMLREAFARRRFGIQTELQLQDHLAAVLTELGWSFKRECSLTQSDRVDFFVERLGVAIEVKISGALHNHLRQMHRYAGSPFVKELVLLCLRPYPLRRDYELCGKPVTCVPVYRCLI
jgi:hypothetical protein